VLPTGPVLPQTQVLNVLGHPAHLQPSLGKLQLDAEYLHFIEELVDLHRCRLVLLIEGMEMINFRHIFPVVLGELVKCSAECGEHGGEPCECGEEPSREPSRCFVGSPVVDWGIQVNDNWEVIGGVPVGIPGHLPLIQAPDPPSRVAVPVVAGDFDPNLSPVLDVPVGWVGEWSLYNWGRPRCGCCLAFLHEEALHVVEVTLALHGEAQAVDELLQEVWVKVFVCSDDVLHGSWGQGSPLDLSNKRSLGGVAPNPSDEVSEDPCVEVRVVLDPLLDFFDGEGARAWDCCAIPPEPFGRRH
jgi:hypothetical protein